LDFRSFGEALLTIQQRPRSKIAFMKKTLLIVGLVLLAPTAFIVALAANSNSDGAPVAFGLWMFFGLIPMVGALFAFIWAGRLH
jgi:FtsH-binding integral membrane protein